VRACVGGTKRTEPLHFTAHTTHASANLVTSRLFYPEHVLNLFSLFLYQLSPPAERQHLNFASLKQKEALLELNYTTSLLLQPFYGSLDFVQDYPGESVPDQKGKNNLDFTEAIDSE